MGLHLGPDPPDHGGVSDWFQQHVLLFAERNLDHAFRRQVRAGERELLVADGRVVDAQAAGLDLPARFPGRGHKPRRHRCGEHAVTLVERARRNVDGRQGVGERAFLEGLARRSFGLIRSGAAVHQRGRLVGEHLLRLVDLGALERRELLDLVER